MKDAITDIVALAGAGLLLWAAFLVATPLGLAASGLCLVLAVAGLRGDKGQ